MDEKQSYGATCADGITKSKGFAQMYEIPSSQSKGGPVYETV